MDGSTLETEIRIKILSSQHEDMSFRVKIRGFNPITKEDMPGVTLSTPPIKVITGCNIEDVLTNIGQNICRYEMASPNLSKISLSFRSLHHSTQVISKPEQIKKREPSRKRTMAETLLDSITRIEKAQEEQNEYINRLLSQRQVSRSSVARVLFPVVFTEKDWKFLAGKVLFLYSQIQS